MNNCTGYLGTEYNRLIHSEDHSIPPVIDYGSRWDGGLFPLGNLCAISELELSTLSTNHGANPCERLRIAAFFLIKNTIQVDLNGSITNC